MPKYSGFWRRFMASFIDGIILSVPGIAVGGTLHYFSLGLGMNIILCILYFPIFESSSMQATPGKALMNMVVMTEDGGRLSFKAALIRFFGRYLSMLVFYIGYLMQPFTKRRQTLHDILSESVVVDKTAEDVNYFRVWKKQFQSVTEKL